MIETALKARFEMPLHEDAETMHAFVTEQREGLKAAGLLRVVKRYINPQKSLEATTYNRSLGAGVVPFFVYHNNDVVGIASLLPGMTVRRANSALIGRFAPRALQKLGHLQHDVTPQPRPVGINIYLADDFDGVTATHAVRALHDEVLGRNLGATAWTVLPEGSNTPDNNIQAAFLRNDYSASGGYFDHGEVSYGWLQRSELFTKQLRPETT